LNVAFGLFEQTAARFFGRNAPPAPPRMRDLEPYFADYLRRRPVATGIEA
jgi:hypothetical protein